MKPPVSGYRMDIAATPGLTPSFPHRNQPPGRIVVELQAVAVSPKTPVRQAEGVDPGGQEVPAAVRRQEILSLDGTEEFLQVPGGGEDTGVRGSDRGEGVDVLAETRGLPAGALDGGVALGDPGFRRVFREVARARQDRGSDHLPAHDLPEGEPGADLHCQAKQHVGAVVVAGRGARREHRFLVDELGEVIRTFPNPVAGAGFPDLLVVLPGLLVRVVGDPGGVGQAVAHRDVPGDFRALQGHDVQDTLVQAQQSPVRQAEGRGCGEELAQGGRVEAHVDGIGDGKAPVSPAPGFMEENRVVPGHERTAGEKIFALVTVHDRREREEVTIRVGAGSFMKYP